MGKPQRIQRREMMCSIFGAVHPFTRIYDGAFHQILDLLCERAGDRGRDGFGLRAYNLKDNAIAYVGNWRATPTPEMEHGVLQPYDGIVHNGTIANAEELGLLSGEIDSQVLPRVLNRQSLGAFCDSVNLIKGSYAIACAAENTVYLATNYKPLYYWSPDGRTIIFSSMARHFKGIVPHWQSPRKMHPYTVLDLRTGVSLDIPRKRGKRAIVVASAGLDSTTAAAKLVKDGYEVCLLHFSYGAIAQSKEAQMIPKIAAALGCSYEILPIDYSKMKGSSPLFKSSEDVSDGFGGAEFAKEWIPARNLVLMSLAVAFAEANEYHYIALGNNLEEAGAYPDNEEEFYEGLNILMPNAVSDGYYLEILQPVGNLMKHEIVAMGIELGAPLELTWSCYRGGETHCGTCAPCLMRRTAFKRNGRTDPVMPVTE
jgi:7-cyano-7-deazaguanine synthase